MIPKVFASTVSPLHKPGNTIYRDHYLSFCLNVSITIHRKARKTRRLMKNGEVVKAGKKARALKQHKQSGELFSRNGLESCSGRRWQMSVVSRSRKHDWDKWWTSYTWHRAEEQEMLSKQNTEADMQVRRRQQGTWNMKKHSQDDFQHPYWAFNVATTKEKIGAISWPHNFILFFFIFS